MRFGVAQKRKLNGASTWSVELTLWQRKCALIRASFDTAVELAGHGGIEVDSITVRDEPAWRDGANKMGVRQSFQISLMS